MLAREGLVINHKKLLRLYREESFNGRLSDDCLNDTLFVSLGHARSALRLWRDDYNHMPPHSGIGGLTPADAVGRVVQHRPNEHYDDPGFQL